MILNELIKKMQNYSTKVMELQLCILFIRFHRQRVKGLIDASQQVAMRSRCVYEHVSIHKKPLRVYYKSTSSFLPAGHCKEADRYHEDIFPSR